MNAPVNNDSALLAKYTKDAVQLLNAKNQLIPPLLGIGPANNSFSCFNTASRKQMGCKFFSQTPPLLEGDPKIFYTGQEQQYGQYNVGATMPSSGIIKKIIPLYRNLSGKSYSPMSLVIYEEYPDDGESGTFGKICSVEITTHYTDNKSYGLKFNKSPIEIGKFYKKGYPLTQIPAIHKSGQYCYGRELLVAYMSKAGVTEDGCIISKSAAMKMGIYQTKTAVVNFGEKSFMLNSFGDQTAYKGFLDIGDTIDETGLLFALRDYDPLFEHINMASTRLGIDSIDCDNDRPYYGLPNAEIVDIRVTKRPDEDHSFIPTGMREQIDKYYNQQIAFYKEILEYYFKMKRARKNEGIPYRINNHFNNLVREALEYAGDSSDRKINGQSIKKKNIKYVYNRTILDSVKLVIKYARPLYANVAIKISQMHGGKCVIVAVWDDERMPVDADGNRVEIIMDNASVDKRMNFGAFYEPFYGACILKARRMIENIVQPAENTVQPAGNTITVGYNKGDYDLAWNKIDRLYEIISEDMSSRVRETILTDSRKKEHIDSVIKDGFYIYLPTHTENLGEYSVKLLLKEYPPCYGPVTFKGINGNTITTKTPVLVGTTHVIVLHKIGDSWSAITSSKLQHHGIPAKMSPSDMNLSPGRKKPIKFPAEAELRNIAGSCGIKAAIEITDRSNNPLVNQQIVRSILTADKPSDIQQAVDRKQFPYGGNRALQQAIHALNCAGIKLKYSFENSNYDN